MEIRPVLVTATVCVIHSLKREVLILIDWCGSIQLVSGWEEAGLQHAGASEHSGTNFDSAPQSGWISQKRPNVQKLCHTSSCPAVGPKCELEVKVKSSEKAFTFSFSPSKHIDYEWSVLRDLLNTQSYEKLLTWNVRMNIMQLEKVIPERNQRELGPLKMDYFYCLNKYGFVPFTAH